jgi:hypothetical protein
MMLFGAKEETFSVILTLSSHGSPLVTIPLLHASPKHIKKIMQNKLQVINCTIVMLHSSALWASQNESDARSELSSIGVLLHP